MLVVDPDRQARQTLVTAFRAHGFQTAEAPDGRTAARAMAAGEVALVVLAVGLPDVRGLEVLRWIRATSATPVIVTSGRRDEGEEVLALEGGADDYLAKPFSARELVARTRSVLRRAGAAAPALRISAPGLEIDIEAREVLVDGRVVAMTAKEFDLLAHLAAHPRRVFTRDELLHDVWRSSAEWQDDATVTEHVRRVRLKVEDDPAHPRRLVTVRGVGYRFEL